MSDIVCGVIIIGGVILYAITEEVNHRKMMRQFREWLAKDERREPEGDVSHDGKR